MLGGSVSARLLAMEGLSRNSTENPREARRRAAVAPAGPPPMTATSMECVLCKPCASFQLRDYRHEYQIESLKYHWPRQRTSVSLDTVIYELWRRSPLDCCFRQGGVKCCVQ